MGRPDVQHARISDRKRRKDESYRTRSPDYRTLANAKAATAYTA
jgi:hypothetical protein